LRESERQFRLLVNGVTDYALFMLDLNGIVTNWNCCLRCSVMAHIRTSSPLTHSFMATSIPVGTF
jgi:hypothetical protein